MQDGEEGGEQWEAPATSSLLDHHSRGEITQKPHGGRRIGPTSTSNQGEAKAIPIPARASAVPNRSASLRAAEQHLPLPLLLGSRDPHRLRSLKHIAEALASVVLRTSTL